MTYNVFSGTLSPTQSVTQLISCAVVCSMFVLLEGRTKDEAFVIGQEIADAVTNDNPKPVKLKLEKVPCLAVVSDIYSEQ